MFTSAPPTSAITSGQRRLAQRRPSSARPKSAPPRNRCIALGERMHECGDVIGQGPLRGAELWCWPRLPLELGDLVSARGR